MRPNNTKSSAATSMVHEVLVDRCEFRNACELQMMSSCYEHREPILADEEAGKLLLQGTGPDGDIESKRDAVSFGKGSSRGR